MFTPFIISIFILIFLYYEDLVYCKEYTIFAEEFINEYET